MLYRLLLCLHFVILASCIPFQEILGTDRFLIVGVTDCHMTTETRVQNADCPYHLTDTTRPTVHSCRHSSFDVIYVPPLPDSNKPPQLLRVFQTRNMLAYQLVDIPFSHSEGHTLKVLPGTTFTVLPSLPFFNSSAIGVLYNHVSSFLYVIHDKAVPDKFADSSLHLSAFLMEPDAHKLKSTFLFNLKIDSYFRDTQWSTDIYSQKFYYHKKRLDGATQVSSVYSIPFDLLPFYLKTGQWGKLEKDFSFDANKRVARNFVHVTNGVVYSVYENDFTSPFGPTSRHRYLGSLKRPMHGMRCPLTISRRGNEALFVLTGWEYCKLRDQMKANYTSCMEETPKEIVTTQSSLATNPIDKYVWIITIVIIVNAIILLLILCFLCARRSDPEPYQYDNMDYDGGILQKPDEVFNTRRQESTYST